MKWKRWGIIAKGEGIIAKRSLWKVGMPEAWAITRLTTVEYFGLIRSTSAVDQFPTLGR